jgi:hypothetical protein
MNINFYSPSAVPELLAPHFVELMCREDGDFFADPLRSAGCNHNCAENAGPTQMRLFDCGPLLGEMPA